ncbi:HEC/Ndc80p family protein [Besnoitia besnoiti]|uniref:Kinetochore protein NDC80 n=1 Tax=Besnoitia besnoiti TaxID=94643 RepID=A0A2A9MCE4_BESBE|nr:HEC/Ndc80p family protein [Besnoitia besnoiti]PFH33333.1 HEC/Ndc80p family protein [Besnoitia besnoiti]
MHDSDLHSLSAGGPSSALPPSSPLRATSPYRIDRSAPFPSSGAAFVPPFSFSSVASPVRFAAGAEGAERGFGQTVRGGYAGNPDVGDARNSFFDATGGTSMIAAAGGSAREKVRREVGQCSFYKSLLPAGAAAVGRGGKKGPGGVQQLLGNEEAKRESVKTLIRFLCYSGFPQQLSPKVFAAPPRSLLVEIWSHLLRKACDDSVQVTNENANEEVPRLFKELGYPLTIAKSSMQAPNSAHQWPLHLHALSWLCELLIYESEVFSRDSILNPSLDRHEDRMRSGILVGEEMISRMLLHHYAHSGGGRDLAPLQQTLYAKIEGEVEHLEKSISARERQLTRAQQELRSISAELEANAALPPELDRLRADLEKLNEGLKQQTTAFEHQEKEVESQQKRRSAMQSEIQQVAAETKRLEAQVKEQGISKAEVEKIRGDIHALRERVALRAKDVDAQQLQLTGLEDEINQHGEELRITTRTCNSLLQRCAQDAETAKFASQAAWLSLTKFSTSASLSLDSPTSPSFSRGAGSASLSDGGGSDAAGLAAHERLLGVRWKAWKADLQRLVESDSSSDAQSRREDERVAAEIEKLKKTRQQLESSRRTEERKISVLHEDLQKVEEQGAQQRQVLSEEIEALQRGVAEHRLAVEGELLKAERRVNDLRALEATRARENEAEAADKLADLRAVQDEGTGEKRKVLHLLQDLTEQKERACAEYERELLNVVARSEKYTQKI